MRCDLEGNNARLEQIKRLQIKLTTPGTTGRENRAKELARLQLAAERRGVLSAETTVVFYDPQLPVTE